MLVPMDTSNARQWANGPVPVLKDTSIGTWLGSEPKSVPAHSQALGAMGPMSHYIGT